MAPDQAKWYADNGYTLMEVAKPPVGSTFDAARVVQDRGLGAVILRTRRIGVEAVRRGEHEYFDFLNKEVIGFADIEAWKPLGEAH